MLTKYGVVPVDPMGEPYRPRDGSGHEHGGAARCRTQYGRGGDAKRVHAQWSTTATGHGDGIEGGERPVSQQQIVVDGS